MIIVTPKGVYEVPRHLRQKIGSLSEGEIVDYLDEHFWSERGRSLEQSPQVVQATYVPLSRIFELVTEGKSPRTDAIDICEQVLMDLQPYERRAVLAYLAATVAVE